MDGNQGKNYLKNYIMQVKPVLGELFEKAKNDVASQDFGPVPLDLVTNLGELVVEGKGIRGALLQLTYNACGGKEDDKVLRTSAFVEVLHTSILVQDDFMDRDPFRRGKKAIHKIFEEKATDLKIKIPHEHYGYSVANCIVDSGLYYSWKILLQSGFDAPLIIKAGVLLSDVIFRLGLGQALDMTISGNDDASEKDILHVLYLKTVEYTAILPMILGATLAGETDETKLSAITEYAKCFGWAFQIQDDILGLYAKQDELGKPIGSDLREGKNTLLMINFRKLANKDQLVFQNKILGNANITNDDVAKMKALLKETGTYDHVLNLGWNYVEEGKKYIPKITSDKELQNILESLIVYMMERTK